MNILVIGDIVGNPGRTISRRRCPIVLKEHAVDFCIANVENAAGGFGVTKEVCDEILDQGVDCMTSGNHIWDKREILPFIDLIPQLLRPLNYPPRQPGKGVYVGRSRQRRRGCDHQRQRPGVHERRDGRPVHQGAGRRSTRSAIAMRRRSSSWTSTPRPAPRRRRSANYLDGSASLVFGTHTHVPTADERILPGGTAYITDLGMTGPYDSVIGVEKEVVIQRFLTAMPARFETAKGDPRFAAAVCDIDEKTGRARGIKRLLLSEKDLSGK